MSPPNSRAISGPIPLLKHSKSIATGLRGNALANASRPDSSYSVTSAKSKNSCNPCNPRESKPLVGALKHLNTTLAQANARPVTTERPRTTSTAANLSHRRVVDEAKEFNPVVEAEGDVLSVATPRHNAKEISKRRAGATISVMGDAILDLIASYGKCRQSVSDPHGMVVERVRKTAEEYEKKFNAYLVSLDTVPEEVKYSIHVITIREQAKDTFHMLKSTIGSVEHNMTSGLMDRLLFLARQLVSEVQRQLTDLNKPLPVLPEMDEDDDSIDTTSSSSRPSTDEATTPVEETRCDEKSVKIAERDDAEDGDWMMRTQPAQVERKTSLLRKVRKVRSSNLLFGSRPRTISTSNDSLNAPTLVTRPSHGYLEPPAGPSRRSVDTDNTTLAPPKSGKAQFTNFPCVTQTTLINDVEYGLHAFDQAINPLKEMKKIAEDNPITTYTIDGSIKTMDPDYIVRMLVDQQKSTEVEIPGEGDVSAIFSCFTLYTTPKGFADSLVEEYDRSPFTTDRMSIALLSRRWVNSFWLDEYKEAIPSLKILVGKLLVDGLNGDVAQGLLNRLQEILKEDKEKQRVVIEKAEVPSRFTSIRCPLAVRLQSSPSTPLSELRADVKALAEQLTLIESEKYLNLLPHEVMYRFILGEKGEASIVEKVKGQARFSESLMNWTSYMVLVQPTPQKRAKMYSFMIKLACVSCLLQFLSTCPIDPLYFSAV